MGRKKIILIFVLIAAATGGYYGYHEYFRPNADMGSLKESFKVNAPGLIAEFAAGDTSATRKYLGKVLVVEGRLKAIDKDEKGYYTLVLGEPTGMSSVRCSMDTAHVADIGLLHPGITMQVKGALTGYNADATGLLGSDVQLNRCIIESK